MKEKKPFLIIIILILAMPASNSFVPIAISQPIPQNNVPDSLNVSLIGRWAYGPCLAVAVDATGTIACFGNGSYLEIVSLANPFNPNRLSKLLLPDAILGVTLSGSYAYVANAGAGLRIIDISYPTRPKQIAFSETLGMASGLAIDGTKVYIADGDRGLLPIDISIPSYPKQYKPFDTDGWATKVAVKGSFAYVADREGGLKVIDISDPANLTLAGSCPTSYDVMDVAISGTYAYLAAGAAGLRVIDISNPHNPSEIGDLDLYQFATAIATDGLRAYLADKEMGLRIIDVTDPVNPKEIGHNDTEGYPQDIALSRGNHVLVADGHNGLRIINTDTYSSPTERGFVATDSSSRGVAVNGNYAYMVKGEAGLRAIDISNPKKPTRVSSLNLTGRAEAVVLNRNHAYVTNYENGLRVIDIANPSKPIEIGYVSQEVNSKRVAIKDNYAYVADTTYGLRIVDISNPSQPSLIQSLEFPSKRAEAIAIQENYAYLAAANDGLIIVDIRIPSQPNLVSILNLNGTTISIDVEEKLAYLGTLQNYLIVVNVANPVNPIKVDERDYYNPLYKIIARAPYIYVANGAGGLRVIDVFYPTNPTEVGFYVTGGSACGLTLDKNYIYLSCTETGLFILEFLSSLLNKPPFAPILSLPANNSFVNITNPQLTWQIPVDENRDSLHFKVEIDKDGDWGNIDYKFESKNNSKGFAPIPPIAAGSGTMNYTTQASLSEANWYWRVAAWDGLVYGKYSETWAFKVDTTVPVINNMIFHKPGYRENWFNPAQKDSVTLIVSYDELYPKISLLSGTLLPDTLYQTSLWGGIDQQVRFNFSIANRSDGSYPFQMSIQDSAGNIGSKAGTLQLDATPPAGYFSNAPDSIAEGQNYIVHIFGASDSLGCGVAQIYLDVFKDGAGIPTTPQDSMAGVTVPGIYYYRYFAEDHLGNRGVMKTDTTVVTPVYAAAPIFPTAQSTEVNAGDDFWIDIQVGTEQKPVENLFSVNFILNYSNSQYIDIVSQDSVLPGELLGNNVNLVSQIDDPNGTITIAISKQAGANNIDGYGNLARMKYHTDPNTPDRTAIEFKIFSVTANDSAGYPIELIPQDTTIWIFKPYADFAMTVVPDSQAIYQGDSTNFIVSFQPLGVFDYPITLSIAGLPHGMEAFYETQPFEIPATDTIVFATSAEIAPGVHYPIITASGGGIMHADTVIIGVLPKPVLSDFAMFVQPDSQTIYQGESANFNVAFQPIGGFNSQINLTISNLPKEMQASYPSELFSIPDSFDVKFSTTIDIASQTYKPIITATGGGITHADTVTIMVLSKPIPPDFSMTVVPDSQTIYQGESTDFNVTFQPRGEFKSRISLTISNLPAGMEAKYPSELFSIPDSFKITFSTAANIAPEIYKPIITATAGEIAHSATVVITVLQKLVVSDFSMTITPDSQKIYQGEQAEFALAFQKIGVFDARISLAISNMPSEMEAAYPSDPITIPSSLNVKFSTTIDIQPGVYHPTIKATGGGVTHQATVRITVLQRPDFIMIIEPDSQTVTAGDSTEFYISFKPVAGFNSRITLAVSNVPAGMEPRYDSRPFNIPYSILVAFKTLRNIPVDVYYPTVTATGGGLTHQKTVAIKVLAAQIIIQEFGVLPNPFTPNNDGYNDYAEFLIPEHSAANISIAIFDVNGNKMTDIRNSRYWFGKDASGRDVKPGAYIYVVKDGEKVILKGVISLAR